MFAPSSCRSQEGLYVRRLKKRPDLKPLDGITVALAALLALELHCATEPPDGNLLPSTGIASQTHELQARNESPPQPTAAALRNILLSRPLFDPTRRPPALPEKNPTAPVNIPRLSGIIVTPTNKIAIFSPAMGAPIIVYQNSRFGPFTVLAISDANVTIKGPGGVIVLRSNFTDLAEPAISTAKTTVLAGGIYLSLIKIALPNTLSWQRLPPVH